jgi:hypothetical protein
MRVKEDVFRPTEKKGKSREGKGREGKGREGREGKGREGKGSQAKPSQAKPSQAKPSQAKPSQAKPSKGKMCARAWTKCRFREILNTIWLDTTGLHKASEARHINDAKTPITPPTLFVHKRLPPGPGAVVRICCKVAAVAILVVCHCLRKTRQKKKQ